MSREFEGRDLDEALRAAADALGTQPDGLAYEIVEEGRRGVFGLGARSVRIRVLAEGPAEAPGEAPATPAGAVEATILRIVSLMGLDLRVETTASNAVCTVLLDGRDRKLLAQHDAELLTALEVVLNRMARRSWPEVRSIRLEIEGLRHRRDEEIVELAREIAEQVHRTGTPRTFPPLNPYERRLVHLTAKEYPGVVSRSEGDGFLKRITFERPTGD